MLRGRISHQPPEDTMQTTPKEAIAEVLNSLDKSNDTLWTDDGSPLVTEVQRLANDKTITRAQINEAIPGFARKVELSVTDTDPVEGIGNEPGEPEELEAGGFDASMEPEVNGKGAALTEDEVRAILSRRIRDAEQALTDARRTTSESRQEELRCEQRLTRAHVDYQRKYPPITAAQNIQDHLAKQGQLAMERAGLSLDTRSQIDVSMERSNRRGWTRPSRPVNNVNSAA